MGPWSREDVAKARAANPVQVLEYIGAYLKKDNTYVPRNPKGSRYHVNYHGRDYRFIFLGEKWFNELAGESDVSGGGGCVDLISYVTGLNFVQSVNICLSAKKNNG